MERKLVSRWNEVYEKKILKEALGCLASKRNLSAVQGLEKHADRWDLRGALLSTVVKEREIEIDGRKLIQKFGSLKLKGTSIASIDFSHSNISYAWFEKCTISNCLFEDTKCIGTHFIACDFINCIFRGADLSNSFMNENIGANSGTFNHVVFEDTNLKECLFYFPQINNCDFVHCNLYATDFNGSNMYNCRFAGKVDGAWFRGFPKHIRKPFFGFFDKVNAESYVNEMKDIDFSDAELTGVSFVNRINLSNCVFPKDNNKYVVVINPADVYSKVRDEMTQKWDALNRKKGLALIENLFYAPDKHDQDMDLVDIHLLTDGGREAIFGRMFFDLVKKVNIEINC